MKRRTLLGCALMVLALVVLLVAPTIAVELDETGTPTAAQAHLPPGLEPVRQDQGCASGGCWLELEIDREELTPAAEQELRDRATSCRPAGILDLRKVCVSTEADGPRLTVYISYKRPLSS